ncbi:lipid-A-disaccharide synthase [Thaumasiovibrio subtropicus]|uniref:lipid-A-disaccharide synthase n=1 Tax=Thaumasiovibrio subtropicus TaxID=1891207 RepID=UPI000B34C44D|nr:lipid-A-disaccharide synthase [Thaumasiovibrio subtropicus]
MTRPLRIGIVAGEISGDILGAGLIRAIREQHPDAEFVGIGGPRMNALGCQSLFEMEELAVMGLVEVLGRLPRLLKVKAELVNAYKANPPDVFVGIDAPDFNLRLEQTLKEQGMRTVHYVSPSVWAWRQKRIFWIEKATHRVLAFLPFEKAFYDKFNVPCTFVGHTMADDIPLEMDKSAAQAALGLDSNKRWLAVLPGSRGGEVSRLSEPFLQTCVQLKAQHPDLAFVVPMVNEKRRQQFEAIKAAVAPDLPVTVVGAEARNAMAAADVVLLASGTAALECMLVKRPMVVSYKVNSFTAWLMRRLLKTPYVSLPNILADRELVPELLQEECDPKLLVEKLNHYLSSDNRALIDIFTELHHSIRCDADRTAAKAVLEEIALHERV